jgi:hypothetical protein
MRIPKGTLRPRPLSEKWKETIMKSIRFYSVAMVLLAVAGCATPPVVVAPVGPNPLNAESVASIGSLQVFSKVVHQYDDQNQGGDGISGWQQHTDYSIYDLHGKPVLHVFNETGHYAETPKQIALPVGKYLVKAQAKDYFWVPVPVEIEAGRTTKVHLDDNWEIPANTSKDVLVRLLSGTPVGWRAELGKISVQLPPED